MNEAVARLFEQRLLVCVGSGGVGKTTTAAALGVAAAHAGRRAAVITADPALRLKDALGLGELSGEPRRVPIPRARGALDALSLDTKRTFDAVVRRLAPRQEIVDRILSNRLYKELSDGLAGSAEYMAMETLHELLHRHAYELIIVDTPPGAHARDLLNAPVRLRELIASGAVRVLKAPTSILSAAEPGLARATLRIVLKVLRRWTGGDVLTDLADFAAAFEHLKGGFQTRAEEIACVLRDRRTSFVLVTSPEPDTIAATLEFFRELKRAGFRVAGVIANRVYQFPPLADGVGTEYPEPLRRKLRANYAEFAALSSRDAAALARLTATDHLRLLATLPVMELPPSSLDGLQHFSRQLLG